MRAVAEGAMETLEPGFVHQMSECLGCRACEAACPSGVPYGALLEDARARIEAATAPRRTAWDGWLRRLLLRDLFAHPSLFRFAAALLGLAQRLHLDRLAAALGFRDAVALAPRIERPPFLARDRRIVAQPSQGTAFLHVGCVMQVAFPQVHEAAVRMLRLAKLSVTIPSAQGCCGAIAVHAGDPESARALARRNIEAFERSGADVYVVDAAGCTAALKEYGHLFADDPAWAQRAARFSSRVRDIVEVLDAMDLPPAPHPI